MPTIVDPEGSPYLSVYNVETLPIIMSYQGIQAVFMPTATVTPCVFNVTLRVDDGVMIQDFNFNVTILSPPPLINVVQAQVDALNQTDPPYF